MFNKIRKLLNPPAASEKDLHSIYVRCGGCGKPHTTRLHLFRDLSLEFGEDGKISGYICRKTLVSGRDCFQRIAVTLQFDTNRSVIGRQIEGGEFMTDAAYQAWQDEQVAGPNPQ